MAMAMRIVTWVFSATEVTQRPLLSVHYTYIKRPPNSRCVFRSGLADTTRMTAHGRATGLPDLACNPKSNWQMTMANDNGKMASLIIITQLELGDFFLLVLFFLFDF
jgi:hypothetical protein